MTSQIEMQLGKKGLTKEFLEDLKRRFENKSVHNIKVCVLKSTRSSESSGREDVKKYSSSILDFLGGKFTARIIGFSIFLKKWRKERKEDL